MRPKTTRVRKKGRIKKVISEWEAFWEDKQAFLAKPVTWHEAIPEVLHIAIALQKNEPVQILKGLCQIREAIKELHATEWNGNLSNLFQLIKQYPTLLEVIGNTALNDSVRCLLITYNKMFGTKVPKGNLFAHTVVYKAYHQVNERRKDVSILCKYILCKFLRKDTVHHFNLYTANTREEILYPDFASRVTPNWIFISQNSKVVDYEYSDFVWNYNIKHLPFIVEPDWMVSKHEMRNFKKYKMNLLKQKLDKHYLEFKQINLLDYFDRYFAEVFMGFISRMHYLSLKIVEQE